MEHKHKRMAELVLKQLTGDISEEEIKELNLIQTELKINDQSFDELLDPAYLAAHFELMNNFDEKASLKKVKNAIALKRHTLSPREYLQRAAILVATIVSAWLFISKPKQIQQRGTVNTDIIDKKVEVQTIVNLIYPDKDYKVEYDRGLKCRYYAVISSSISMSNLMQFLSKYDYNLTVKGKIIIVHF
jgi:hypothetical protein